jgi:hypothetical protein
MPYASPWREAIARPAQQLAPAAYLLAGDHFGVLPFAFSLTLGWSPIVN